MTTIYQTRGPGMRHYVYQPKLTKLGEHEVLVEDGERVIYITPAQAKFFIEDFPMLGVKSWNDLTDTEQEHIHELCGGRIIPHVLIAENLFIGFIDQGDSHLFVLFNMVANDIEVASPDMIATLGQIHALAPIEINIASPSIGAGVVADVLIDALGFAVTAPTTPTVTIGQWHIFYADWLNSVESPSIGIGVFVVGCTATPLATSAPVLGTPELT